MTAAAKNDPTRIEAQKKYDTALAEARKLSAEAAEAHFNVDRPRRELLARLRGRREISHKTSDLRDARNAAGARFAAAVDELHWAFTDLAALDHVLANRNVNPDHVAAHSALGAPPDLWSLAHPVYAPHKLANWNTEIEALRDRYIAAALAEPEAPPPLRAA